MNVHPISTHLIQVGESLFEILDRYLPVLPEECIVAVTSKIVSVCEGSVVEKSIDKDFLVKREADLYLKEINAHNVLLTIKNGILIPNAGIDASNADGVYILYPEDIFLSAENIWRFLKEKRGLRRVGVLITDSHTTPMRWGVTGIGIGWCGFHPLNNYIGEPDCYGEPLKFTKVNAVDALAASAVFTMGEGSEQTPLALLTDIKKITFLERPPTREEIDSLKIPMDQDLYGPLLTKGTWIDSKM